MTFSHGWPWITASWLKSLPFLSFDEYYRQYKRELAAKEKFKINYPDLIYETVYLRKIDLQADNNTRKFYKISPEYLYYFENNEWVYIDYMFSFDLSKENLDDLWQKDVSTGEGTEITCEDLRNQNEFAWFASDGVDAFLLLEQKDDSYYIAECITNESHQVIGYKYISRLIVCSPDYAENLENYGELSEKWAKDWTKPKLYTWLPGDYLIMYEKIKING